MFLFEDENDLMRSIEKCAERAERQTADDSNLKREQMMARARAAAFHEALEMVRDYFLARQSDKSADIP